MGHRTCASRGHPSIPETRLRHARDRHRRLHLGWFSEPHGYNFNGYLVRHDAGNLCIDPVQPSDDALAEIVRMHPTKILLTNRNIRVLRTSSGRAPAREPSSIRTTRPTPAVKGRKSMAT